MHEYCAVRELVRHLLGHLAGAGRARVMEVRLRRGIAFGEGPLRQAFTLLAEGTPLAGAQLEIEEFAAEETCPACGVRRRIDAGDVIARVYVCPDCETPRQIEHAEDLELLGFTTTEICAPESSGTETV